MFGQLSPSRMPAGEPILLNVRDLNHLTQKQKQVLNFGNTPTTLNWPIGTLEEFLPTVKEEVSFIKKLGRLFNKNQPYTS